MIDKPWKRWRKVVPGVLLFTLVAVGLYWGHWATFGHRFTVITPDRVYQSAVMSPRDLAVTIRDHRIRAVIDLRTNAPTGFSPQQEGLLLHNLDVRYYHLPSRQVPEKSTVEAFLAVADDPDNYPMLIHCHHGEGRSVLFAALYRIEFEGWDTEQARKASRFFHFRGTFGPEGEKGKFLRSYVPRLDSRAVMQISDRPLLTSIPLRRRAWSQ